MGKLVQRRPSAPFRATDLHFSKPLFWLLLITLIGGAFRFYNPNWDYQHSFHPDERNILGQTAGIQASTGWRVSFFAYGQLPVYLYRATGELVSTPQFFLNLFNNSSGFASALYFIFLALVGGFCVWFLITRWDRILKFAFPELGILAFGIVVFLGFFCLAFFCHGFEDWVAGDYWFFLSALFGVTGWALSKKEWSLYSFGAGAFLFGCLLIFKFYKIFSIWFDQLDGFNLKGGSFALIVAASLGVSLWIAKEFELEWAEMPMYYAAGATAFLGILPFFLPDPVARLCGVLAFVLLVCGLSLWWAWESAWGRGVLVFFSLWAIFSSFDHAGRQYNGYGECMVIGRVWAAAFSTSTIVAVYLLVKRIYQRTGMALLAAASFAFAVVSIEQAHYCITESLITFMLVLVALSAWEIIQKGDWTSYLLAGGAFGLSMASKTSSLYYVFIILIAHLVLLSKKSAKDWEKEDKKLGENEIYYSAVAISLLIAMLGAFAIVIWKFKGVFQDLFEKNPAMSFGVWMVFFVVLALVCMVLTAWGVMEFRVLRAQTPQWIKLAATGGLAVFLFCLFSPWSLLDYPKFMESQGYEWHVVSIADACYVLQFKDTPRYLFHLQNLMSAELWWPLGITVVLGMIWVLGRFVFNFIRPVNRGYLLPVPFSRTKGFAFSLPDLLLLCWFIPYFGFIGSWNTKFIRYMVPLIPFFCIFGARLLTDLFEWAKKIPFGRFLKPVLWALVIGPSLFYSAAYMHVYRFQHPWIESSIWMFKNIPPGAKIFNEAWGDGLPVDVSPTQDSRVDRIMGPAMYHSQDITPYEMHGFPTDDSPIKRSYYANLLPQGDYISISSKKLWYTLTDETPEFRPHGFNIYPITSRYYRLLWSGLLGYKMVAEIHNFPSLFGWEHPDDMAEESFSVYDHPRVYIFKKVEDVTPERILKLLDSDVYVKGVNRDIMRDITPANVDDFIASRHKYLEDNGLLAQLETVGNTTTAASATPVVVPQVPTSRPILSQVPTPGPTSAQAGITEIPTPEIKVDAPATVPKKPLDAKTLQVLQDYAKNPVIENDVNSLPAPKEEGGLYQLRAWFSWLIALILLGWLALPLTLRLLSSFPSGAYSLSKVLGFFIFAWVIWFSTSVKLCRFTFGSCWVWFLLLTSLSLFFYWRDQKTLGAAYKKWSKVWMIQEAAFAGVFLLFTLVKIFISHIHDPGGEGYNGGGEAGMDYGFLASVVRGESFPPQNMWMAGQPIGYSFYYGHLMMGVLTKFLGLVPAVTYNLALITLFALIFSCAFGIAFALSGRLVSGWIAGFLCAAGGNPAGAKQIFDALHQTFMSGSFNDVWNRIVQYDYWGPTRVIPNSINEFPYFSVLYGDMHAHTLAMPFALLLLAIIGSYFLSPSTKPFNWSNDWPRLLSMGFLLGGIAFLNTWEVPTWLALAGLAFLVRNISGLNPMVLHKSFGLLLGLLIPFLVLLGWVTTLYHGFDPLVLGGTKFLLVPAILFPLFIGLIVLFVLKKSNLLAQHLGTAIVSFIGIFVIMGILWAPFFANFAPQQSEVLWVTPNLRTAIGDFFGIYGLFVTVLILSFMVGCHKEITNWLGSVKKTRWDLDLALDKVVGFTERLINPQQPVLGMLFIGVMTMFLIWGASWVHWTDPPDRTMFSMIFASFAGVAFATAIIIRKGWVFWATALGMVGLWLCALVLHVIHFFQEMSLGLGMELFSVLWLLAFLHLGLAIKTVKDRSLSFSYLLVALFFFIIATLEIFVMKEYLGGDYERNNSLFKFGINAWELASITVGIFLPKIISSFAFLLKAVKKEAALPRVLLLFVSAAFLFILFHNLLDSFLSSMGTPIVYVIDMVLVGGFLGWGWVEKWVKNAVVKITCLVLGGILILLSLLALLPQDSGAMSIAQRWASDFDVNVLFPALLAAVVLGILNLIWEGQRNMGRLMVFNSWRALVALFALTVLVYPCLATVRKCHGFFDGTRKQWVSYIEKVTLDGLEYLPRENPYDAAAIQFLNDHVPGQPCLVEFVGEGYNSWGSRFSIFTGIPAIMGWDGHVKEWLTGRAGHDQDIDQRFQATETIFRTLDPQLAKKYLDTYGIRLVMVGTVERGGVPGRKGGYPPEGLAKFPGFLPLIYKNPQVEIYYNPPPTN